jgi:hypothetical protein
LRSAMMEAFGAGEPLRNWPEEQTGHLVVERYATDDWNLQR